MGKSTTAQLLARNDGFVYYEADCFGSMRNPYVPLDVEDPSMAQFNQKNLRGPGMEERKALINDCKETWMNCLAGREYDKEKMVEYYHHMAGDIRKYIQTFSSYWFYVISRVFPSSFFPII